MQRILTVTLIFFCIASAQLFFRPKTDPKPITALVNGSPVNGTIDPTTDNSKAYHGVTYSFFVPKNAKSVTIDFKNQNTSACELLFRNLRTGNGACSDLEYADSQYFCAAGNDPEYGTGETPSSETITSASVLDRLSEWIVDDYWYVTIYRNNYMDGKNTCQFSLSMTVDACETGSVGSSGFCASTEAAALPFSKTGVAVTSNAVKAWEFNIAEGTGRLDAVITTNNVGSGQLRFYGKSYGIGTKTSNDCNSGEPTTSEDGTKLIYKFSCYVPRSGKYYISHPAVNYDFTADIAVTATACPAGKGGFDCSYTLLNAADNFRAIKKFSVPFTAGSGLNDATFQYMYIDIPAAYNGSLYRQLEIVTTSDVASTGIAAVYLRKNGFPEDLPYGWESRDFRHDVTGSSQSKFGLNQYDFIQGGRYYLGLECATAPKCTFEVKFLLSGGDLVKEDDPNTVNPDGESSSGLIIVPSIMTLIAMLVALF